MRIYNALKRLKLNFYNIQIENKYNSNVLVHWISSLQMRERLRYRKNFRIKF